MKETRHPHPHVDPRQPRHQSSLGTNPPVFAWKPIDEAADFHLQVARDPDFADLVLDIDHLEDPLYLPEQPLPPGPYFWTWSAADRTSEIFEFDIPSDALELEVPPAAKWLRRLPEGHPRIYLRPEQVQQLRNAPPDGWDQLKASADNLLPESHEMPEPEFLPDRNSDYAAFWKIWYPTMWGSRAFVKGAEALALAYLVSGEEAYARAACQRLASISRWDPEGASFLGHNDEAHMSVIWHGANACDWVWDQFTDEERTVVIDQYRRRGEITFEHMHDLGCYGIARFDSHAGREIVFLAHIAMVFHEHIPAAGRWLEWLRPVLCGVWPIWAGDDGAWSEGPSYGLAYITIMTMFASSCKRATGIDLYRRPFWGNHARWRQWCLPPYAEWMGFGDHSERWASGWHSNADLVDLIGRETDTDEFNAYVAAFRREAEQLDTPAERQMPGVNAQLFLAPPPPAAQPAASTSTVLRTFPVAGWAALRTHLEDPARDIAFIFRSSRFGSYSHSHANNNDFILHVGGRVLAMPSGYYSGYGSDHHAHWVWHTKSHNCLTLSDAPQLMRSHDSTGAIDHPFENEHLAYFRGTADASYADRATRCRRHVLYLKEHTCILLIDEFVAQPGIVSALQWNIHSWNQFAIDKEQRSFLLERDESSLETHFLYHHNAFFSQSEGWDPPPMKEKENSQWHQQYHLRFTPSGLIERRNLGVILCPGHAHLQRAQVQTERVGQAEVARIGDDLILVNQGGPMECENLQGDDLILLRIGGRRYAVGDEGLSC
jgi:hypothetical protein